MTAKRGKGKLPLHLTIHRIIKRFRHLRYWPPIDLKVLILRLILKSLLALALFIHVRFEPALAGKYDDDYSIKQRIKLARQLIYDGHNEDARRLIAPLCHKPDTTAEMYCILVSTYLDDPEQDPKANKEIEECLKLAMKIRPEDGEAYRLMAEHLLALGDYQGVLKFSDKALHAKYPDRSTLRQSAIARSNLGQHEAALADFNGFMAFGTHRNFYNLNTKASLLSTLKRYDEASRVLRQSLLLRNQDQTVYQLANCLQMAGKHQTAIDELTKLIKKNPLDEEALTMRARAEVKNKDLTAAVKDFSKAVELEPSAKLYKERAEVYTLLNQKASAAKDLARANELIKQPF